MKILSKHEHYFLHFYFAIFFNICHKRSRDAENLHKNIINDQEEVSWGTRPRRSVKYLQNVEKSSFSYV